MVRLVPAGGGVSIQAGDKKMNDMNACINTLQMIDAAKQQWALEFQKPATAMPTWDDIRPYISSSPDWKPPSALTAAFTPSVPLRKNQPAASQGMNFLNLAIVIPLPPTLGYTDTPITLPRRADTGAVWLGAAK